MLLIEPGTNLFHNVKVFLQTTDVWRLRGLLLIKTSKKANLLSTSFSIVNRMLGCWELMYFVFYFTILVCLFTVPSISTAMQNTLDPQIKLLLLLIRSAYFEGFMGKINQYC